MAYAEVPSNLPLTESTLFILLSLAQKPKHGYAILKDVESLSGRRIVLSTGTLYGALKRMLEDGWVERADDSEPDESGRPRKTYALTALGQRILAADVERLQRLVGVAAHRLAGGAA